jgi:hypothetical protein
MEQPGDGLRGGSEIWVSLPTDPDYVPPSPRPEPGPLPDWLRPHVEAVLGDMQQPTPVKLRLGYYPDEELEHFGVVLFREADGTGFGFGVLTSGPEADLLIALAEGLQENFSETREAWGQARPACPGHTHAAAPNEVDGVAWWICPHDGRAIAPIGTLAPLR